MRIVARGVSKGTVLPETDVVWQSGAVTVVPIESGQRPSVLGLILSGRMAPDSGEVTIDGEHDLRRLRGATVLVDAPDVSAPEDDLPLAAVLREELVLSGVRFSTGAAHAARRMLVDEELVAYRGTPMSELPTAVRVRALAHAAVRAKGTRAVVIVTPDRHGGDPLAWYAVARELAERGLAVVVLAGFAAVDAIAVSFPGVSRDADRELHEEPQAVAAAESGDAVGTPDAPPSTASVLRHADDGIARTRPLAVVPADGDADEATVPPPVGEAATMGGEEESAREERTGDEAPEHPLRRDLRERRDPEDDE